MFNKEKNGKNKKITTITEKGKERFFELMKMPVTSGAHNADIYLIKIDVMQHIALEEQIQLLDQFYQEQKDIIKNTQDVLKELEEENSKDHWYASKIDFDNNLDFSLFDKLGKTTKYEASGNEEISKSAIYFATSKSPHYFLRLIRKSDVNNSGVILLF